MDIRQLATFRLVARTLSFTQAAGSLGYVQSAITAQIQSLETELGVPLFDRLGKRIALTDAGQRLLDYAEQILTLADEARVTIAASEEPMGTLTFSAPESLCTYRLPSVLKTFRLRYPRVKLQYRPCPSIDMQRRVTEGLLDVAFVLDEPLTVKHLNVDHLMREPLWVLAPPEHPLTQNPGVEARDLEGEAMLLTEVGCKYRSMFEHVLTAEGVYPPTTLEFGSVEAIKQCVMVGMGITFLPALAVTKEVAQGQLVPLAWAGKPFEIHMQMIWHKNKWMSPALTAFLDIAREVLCPQQISSQ